MKTKIKNGWLLMRDEKDRGYIKWSPNQNWQDGIIYRGMQYCRDFRGALDIGACYGATSKILSKNFKKVYSYEPYTPFYECTIRNLKNQTNVSVFNFGLSSVTENKKINVNMVGGRSTYSNHLGTSILPNGEIKPQIKRESAMTKVNRLDDLDLSGIPNIDLIKIDVEGWETEVINGGISTLKNHLPTIIIESRAEIIQVLGKEIFKPLGYKCVDRSREDDLETRVREKQMYDWILVHDSKIPLKNGGVIWKPILEF